MANLVVAMEKNVWLLSEKETCRRGGRIEEKVIICDRDYRKIKFSDAKTKSSFNNQFVLRFSITPYPVSPPPPFR